MGCKSWAVKVGNEKTMWSDPNVMLVNSNGAPRSSVETVRFKNTTYYGDKNTGTPGYRYYISIKPSLSQHGTDHIKLSYTSN